MTSRRANQPRRFRKGRFFARVFTRLGTTLSLGLTLACLLTWAIMQRWLRDNELDHLQRDAHLAHAVVAREWPYADADDLVERCRSVDARTGLRLTVIAPSGAVLADSQADATSMENHGGRREVREALQGRVGMDERLSATVGRSFIYVAVPIVHEDRTAAVVRIAAPAEYVAQRAANLARWIGIGLAVALPMSLAIAWLVAREVAVPVQRVSQWARRLATGDLTTGLTLGREDEVGLVADAMERMRVSLAALIRETQQQRQDLHVTIRHVGEGVIAVDRDGKVLLANPAAGRLLGLTSSLVGGPLREQLGARPLARLWDDALAGSEPELRRETTVVVAGTTRTLDAAVIRVQSEDTPIAWLLCLRDVTAAARSAAMKADFVANASHELRTPVANIRAAVDTLLDAGIDAPTRERFIQVIDRNVERLQDLTDDLMQLNRVEAGQADLNLEWFDPADAFAAIRAAYADVLARRSITLDFHGTIRRIRSDRRQFELVIKNLIDNAIKFSPDGGRVEMRGRKSGGAVWFDIQDRGCGIPREHLDRVFERFYQVNRSRGGARPGTGLGLAIVKHAVHALGGEVSIASELGVGTTVSFSIPPSTTDVPVDAPA